jgi:ABC-type Na+ transport system ATPase subunit NatA
MAVKYYCDCCGKETNISEEHMETKIKISVYTPRKFGVFNTDLSGEEVLHFKQYLCDQCKKKAVIEIDNFIKEFKQKYSKETDNPNYNWGLELKKGDEIND